MNLGRLDRQGALYSKANSIGLGGAVKPTLTKVCDLPLSDEKDNPATRNRITVAREGESTISVFTTRWFDGLKTGMVLICEGHTYEIIRREEMGRREGWRIMAREDV